MNKTTTTIVIGVLIGGVLGYMIGYSRGIASYTPKIAALNKMFPALTQATSLTGKVEQVGGSSFTLGGLSLSPTPFADNYPTTRQITITSATKISKSIPKDPAVFAAEILAFQKKNAGRTTTRIGNEMLPPTPFSQVDIKLSDLKAGDTVTVSAASDILQAASFTATSVQLMSSQSVAPAK